MRTLTMAALLGLVITSGAFAESRGGGIMKRNRGMKPPVMGADGDRESSGSMDMARRMEPVFAARGFALGGSGYELFGLHVFPKRPRKEQNSESETTNSEAETTNSEESQEMDRPLLRGMLRFANQLYRLDNVEVELEEIQDELVDGEKDEKKGKVISSLKATLYKIPEMSELDEGQNEIQDEEVAEGESDNSMNEQEQIGEISIHIEIKEGKDFPTPVVRGEAMVDGAAYDLYAKPVMGKGPRGPHRGFEDGESGQSTDEDDNDDNDDSYDDNDDSYDDENYNDDNQDND